MRLTAAVMQGCDRLCLQLCLCLCQLARSEPTPCQLPVTEAVLQLDALLHEALVQVRVLVQVWVQSLRERESNATGLSPWHHRESCISGAGGQKVLPIPIPQLAIPDQLLTSAIPTTFCKTVQVTKANAYAPHTIS
jgi:hypothetical protein